MQRPDRGQVVGDRGVEHQVLGPVLLEGHDLRFPGVRVDPDAAHVGFGIADQHLLGAGRRVDPDQPAGLGADRADAEQRAAVLAERDDVAGQRVVGGHGQQRPPVRVGAVPHHHHEAPVGLRRDPGPDRELRVCGPVDEAGVLDFLGQLAGDQVEPVNVVQFGVVAVQRDQQFGRELPLHGHHPRLHAVERRQVAAVHGLEVDVVQPPVLVAAGVLQVQQVPAIVGPREQADAAVAIVGDHPRRGPVHPGVGARRRHPDVEDPLVRRYPRQPGSVRRDSGAYPLGVAEENLPRNQFDHASQYCLGGRPPVLPGGRPQTPRVTSARADLWPAVAAVPGSRRAPARSAILRTPAVRPAARSVPMPRSLSASSVLSVGAFRVASAASACAPTSVFALYGRTGLGWRSRGWGAGRL